MKNLILLSTLIAASIMLAAVNLAYATGPTAVNDNYDYSSLDHPRSAIFTILANDQPVAGTRAAIDPNSVRLIDETGAYVISVTRPGGVTLTVLMDGQVRFEPPVFPSGERLRFEYVVRDVNGVVSNVATIEISTPVFDLPMGDLTAWDDACQYQDYPNPATFPVLDNDPALGDEESQILNIASVHLIDPSTNLYSKNISIPGYGTLNVLEDGKVRFEPQKQADTTLTFQYVFWDHFYMQRSNVGTVRLKLVKNGVLPVRLASFDASREEEATLLAWSTTEEVNSEGFEIQKSLDGKKWNPIGYMKAGGQSKVVLRYNFRDSAPHEGQNLYRLKMIDQDNSFAFSGIKSIRFEGVPRIVAFPNPTTDRILIQDYQNVKQVTLYNAAGAKVFESQAIAADGINVTELPQGMYTLSTTLLNRTMKTTKVAIER